LKSAAFTDMGDREDFSDNEFQQKAVGWAIDLWRRRERLDERHRPIALGFKEMTEDQWQPIPEDELRLVFIACHPVLSRE
jgi:predicted RNA polymerase sigma factor